MGNAHATGHAAPAAHGHDAHGHAAHGHDAHGHDAHGHDAHGHDAHGHDAHGHADNGKVVAGVVIVLLIGMGLAVGRRVPTPHRTPAGGSSSTRRATTGTPGIVVLEDGRVLRGPIVVSQGSISIVDKGTDGKGSEEVVVQNDPSVVRWSSAEGDALTDAYWALHAGKPIAREFAQGAPAGGIVVLKSGQVLVGRVTEDASGVTVRWPYGATTYTGEVRVTRDRIRYVDPAHDTLGDAYWTKHAADPIDAAWQRSGSQSRPAAPADVAPATARTRAQLAQTRGDWHRGATEWSAVVAETKDQEDYLNLRTCCNKLLDDHAGRNDADRAFAIVRDLLAPHAGMPDGRQDLATVYLNAARWCITRRKLDDADRWAAALRGLGGEMVGHADDVARAIADVRAEAEREEAEHEEGGRRPG